MNLPVPFLSLKGTLLASMGIVPGTPAEMIASLGLALGLVWLGLALVMTVAAKL